MIAFRDSILRTVSGRLQMRFVMCMAVALLVAAGALGGIGDAAASERDKETTLEARVNAVIRPLMAEHRIPGMAVAIAHRGQRHVFAYGLADKANARAVTADTLFELGSISKVFAATLAGYAQARGELSLSDPASRHLPALADSRFDAITLLQLGTYTAGGLPLQFPDAVTDEAAMIAYYRQWRPAHAAGTQRVYSNPSIGLFGFLVARRLGLPFETLMEETLFPKLGLTDTHISVPPARMNDYAYGYDKDDAPVRVNPGMLAAEAYGVKTSAADMLRLVEANIDLRALDDDLRQAALATQTGYFRIGVMTQGLGWERYPYPVDLDRLLAGNAPGIIFEANPAVSLEPPQPPRPDMLLNKTGSTNGFGAYVVVVPGERIGIVLLANRNYPIPARVRAAYRLLEALDAE